MIEGPDGVGVAGLPHHPRPTCCPPAEACPPEPAGFAALSASWDPLDMAVAVAAINAHYNRRDIDAPSGNGVRAFRNVPG